jgi:hypothetical protein
VCIDQSLKSFQFQLILARDNNKFTLAIPHQKEIFKLQLGNSELVSTNDLLDDDSLIQLKFRPLVIKRIGFAVKPFGENSSLPFVKNRAHAFQSLTGFVFQVSQIKSELEFSLMFKNLQAHEALHLKNFFA